MRRTLPLIVALSIAVALGLSARAQAPSCADTPCTFLPIVTNRPTAEPSGVFIRTNHSSYTTSSNTLHIIGEVQNNTGSALEFVKVSARLFNGTQLVATGFADTILDYVRPNTRTCFDLVFFNPPDYTSYAFEAPTYRTTTAPDLALSLLNASISQDANGKYHILGQVRNDMSVQVNGVREVAALVDSTGRVLDCNFTYTTSIDLAPGQTSAFDLRFSGTNYGGVVDYHMQVEGRPQ
jgi:hypothetical protein